MKELRDHPLFAKVLRTEPESFLRTLTTDGASVIAVVRPSVTDWLGVSGGGPLSDEDAEMVAEGITRLGVSLVLTREGPDPDRQRRGLARVLCALPRSPASCGSQRRRSHMHHVGTITEYWSRRTRLRILPVGLCGMESAKITFFGNL